MQNFDDVLFTMTLFSAKKLGKEKNLKAEKRPQTFPNYVLQ